MDIRRIMNYVWIFLEGLISIICSFNIRQIALNYDNVMQFGTENEQRLIPITMWLLIGVCVLCILLMFFNYHQIRKSEKKEKKEVEHEEFIETARFLKKKLKKHDNDNNNS